VTAIAADVGRCSTSALYRILGVPRSTHYRILAALSDAANVLGRGIDGHRPRTHVAIDPAYVRTGLRWRYVCPLIDLHDREIVDCSFRRGPGGDDRVVPR